MFNRGQTAVALRLGGKRALRAHLAGRIVWDGTRGAVVQIPLISVSATLKSPVIAANARISAPLMMTSASVFAPAVAGSATVRPETMIAVTATVFNPEVSATAEVETPLIMSEAVLLAPVVSESFDRSVAAPRIDVTATAFAPAITGDFLGQAPLIVATAELWSPLVTATGTAVVNVPLISSTATINPSAVKGTAAISVPLISANGSLLAPQLRYDGKVTAPMISATGSIYVPDVQAINFKPSGMVKSANSNITSTSATLVTGMAVNANLPGSTVTSDALVSSFAGPVRIGFSIELATSGGTTGNAAVFKNGVQVGSTFTLSVPYNGATMIFGSVTTTVAVSDQITLRYWSASASYAVTVKATTTRLNVSEGGSAAVGGSVSATYTPDVGWSDMPLVADSGTTLSGNAIVVPAAHPNAILAATADINSGSAMALRFTVNGTVVHTGTSAAAYDVRMVEAAGIALAAGDLVKVQVQRISTFATTVAAGAKLAII
ncbi:hypothetical protein [Rhodococcus qingshengii]|uniref:hypothetical protein n=1 Tax=Rhodococcus qingshengii TaxID=334542 RepID=UPI001AE023F5|nr:hypothetical protein [Rhodococcus qingshengii]MCQ4148655.1 hypothetical protein [Rhodococcus qingshengii]